MLLARVREQKESKVKTTFPFYTRQNSQPLQKNHCANSQAVGKTLFRPCANQRSLDTTSTQPIFSFSVPKGRATDSGPRSSWRTGKGCETVGQPTGNRRKTDRRPRVTHFRISETLFMVNRRCVCALMRVDRRGIPAATRFLTFTETPHAIAAAKFAFLQPRLFGSCVAHFAGLRAGELVAHWRDLRLVKSVRRALTSARTTMYRSANFFSRLYVPVLGFGLPDTHFHARARYFHGSRYTSCTACVVIQVDGPSPLTQNLRTVSALTAFTALTCYCLLSFFFPVRRRQTRSHAQPLLPPLRLARLGCERCGP